MLGRQDRANGYRVKGDAARDGRNWPEAERAYAAYVAERPTDFGILVQYAHSLKENGKLEDAEAAYRRALSLRPDDHDAITHLAHLLKRMDQRPEAARAFAQLVGKTGDRKSFQELQTLMTDGQAIRASDVFEGRGVANDSMLIELDDLLSYLDVHKTLSGIQRVQVGIIQHVLDGAQDTGPRHLFVLNEVETDCLWLVHMHDLRAVVEYVTSAKVEHDRLKTLVRRVRENATGFMPQAGQSYIILGAFWMYGVVAPRYVFLKKAGVVMGAYVYDLIPITNTEFCDEGLPHEFMLSFSDGLRLFDFILTISEYTATEVRRFIQKYGLPSKPIQAVLLAHSSTPIPQVRSPTWGSGSQFLQGRPFVLMVSTIEARKNHGYLVSAWKMFVDEGLDPPDLVFVGRFGWRVTSLIEMLETSRFLDGRVHIVHDLSDAELDTLYDACLFTAFPSMVEGWGLPVGEGLAHGKPCVASSTSSIPEVGGSLVDYIDPLNLRDGLEVLRRMVFDATYREARAAEIRKVFRARTWSEVGADLLRQVDRLSREVVANKEVEAILPSSREFRMGDLAPGNKLPGDYPAYPYRSMLQENWYPIESTGCWMRGKEGTLVFKTDLGPGSEIVVYVGLYAPGFASLRNRVAVIIGEQTDLGARSVHPWPVRVDRVFMVRATGRVTADNRVVVTIRLDGHAWPHSGETRPLALGLSSIGYAPASGLQPRVALLESMLHVSVRPRSG